MTDLDRLQGSWNITSLEVDGQKMPAPGGARIVICGTRFQSLGMGAVYEGTVGVDGKKKPKTFDLTFTAGPEKGNRSLGIYELKGDNWKLCLTVDCTNDLGGIRKPLCWIALQTSHDSAVPICI